ncbi:endonuclease/exonuclease/phosphatase family protein [Clostridium sporogenes]|uniref:endonuclease/exonuclease/phosphatase family protein n=1 Tax=Clostridium sporogenes TaxID=1509 RepID=UPI002239116A|nr:endonuclease/exonuclease/phosphatase family protein [Clostridium sporogenes]MCW6107828.1 endonuclease/exonuclease/phosphatase family protein [Clostridium sporogenes]
MRKDLKIIEWNINQRTNYNGTNNIPQLVFEELKEQVVDIIILTEFFKGSNWIKFINNLDKYNIFVTDNSKYKQNDVLIAIKKDIRIKSVHDIESTTGNNNPNFLRVDIEHKDKILSVIGVRIRVENYGNNQVEMQAEMEKRKAQNNIILNYIRPIKNPVIVIGDFNNNRRNTPIATWNINVIEKSFQRYNYTMHTPYGASIYEEYSPFAEDHILAKNINVQNSTYSRDFVNRDNSVYRWDKNFSLYNSKTKKKELILPPYPDHAILSAKLNF